MIEEIPVKTILNKARFKPEDWFGVEFISNIYKGCPYGCIYCESRSNCYGYRNFDTVQIKANADELMTRALRTKRQPSIIELGNLSDSYNPYEEELRATRKVLKAIASCRFGVDLCTKSPLITRDIDLFEQIAWAHSATAKLTITTSDDALGLILEPQAPPASERFRAIGELSAAGIFNGIMFTPIMPFITDSLENVESIVELAHENGANFIYTRFGISMRDGQNERYMKLVKSIDRTVPRKMRETYGLSFYCYSKQIETLRAVFEKRCNQAGILYDMKSIIAASRANQQNEQSSLF